MIFGWWSLLQFIFPRVGSPSYLASVYFTDSGAEPTRDHETFASPPVGFLTVVTHLLSALENLPQPHSSSRSQRRIPSSQTESETSPGFLERTGQEGTVHTQVAGTWVSSRASVPALETGEPSVVSQKRDSSGQEYSGPPFSWTQSHPPPSDHPSCEYSCPQLNPPISK